MKRYRTSFLISAILISIPSLFLVVSRFGTPSLSRALFLGGVLFAWWFSYVYLCAGKPYSFARSFALVNIAWWPFLIQTVRRVLFVIENGGMERADGYGSPLAFLLGVLLEQFFFLPLSFSMIFGIAIIVKRPGNPLQAVDKGNGYVQRKRR